MSISSFVVFCGLTSIIFHVQAVDYLVPFDHAFQQQTVFNPQSLSTYQHRRHHAQQQLHLSHNTQANQRFYQQNQGITHDQHSYRDRYHVTDSVPGFQTHCNYDQRPCVQQPPAYMTHKTQANNQRNQEHSVNGLPHKQSVENQNRAQHGRAPVLSEKSLHTHDQMVRDDRIRSALAGYRSPNQLPKKGKSFQSGANHKADEISQSRRHYGYGTRNRYGFATKTVYVKHVPNNWMLNGIENVIDHVHQFGCDINDEQRIKLVPNYRNDKHGELGTMMILFEDDKKASQFIACVNTIPVNVNHDLGEVFLSAEFAWRNKLVDKHKDAKSFTGVYCDINSSLTDCNAIELMLRRVIMTCSIAKSMDEIEFEPPCLPGARRINYKAASKKLRNQAIACLIKKDDICTAVGTW